MSNSRGLCQKCINHLLRSTDNQLSQIYLENGRYCFTISRNSINQSMPLWLSVFVSKVKIIYMIFYDYQSRFLLDVCRSSHLSNKRKWSDQNVYLYSNVLTMFSNKPTTSTNIQKAISEGQTWTLLCYHLSFQTKDCYKLQALMNGNHAVHMRHMYMA